MLIWLKLNPLKKIDPMSELSDYSDSKKLFDYF